jgi:hypothetical protein
VLVIKTKDTQENIRLAAYLAKEYGAISCEAYTTDNAVKEQIMTK